MSGLIAAQIQDAARHVAERGRAWDGARVPGDIFARVISAFISFFAATTPRAAYLL